MKRGDPLVPKETPIGPADARLAWADALGSVVIVRKLGDHGRRVLVNIPERGSDEWVDTLELLDGYEAPDAPMPRGWDSDQLVRRAALAGALAGMDEITRVEDLADPLRWEAIAKAVMRVQLEGGIVGKELRKRVVFGG